MMDHRFRQKMEKYWEKERKKTLREIRGIDIKSWFDFWHVHPDWNFKGSRDKEMKAWVNNITYEFLIEIESLAAPQWNRLQVWATLCENTGSNAVFIHSENPNGSQFRIRYKLQGKQCSLKIQPIKTKKA